MIEPQVCAKWTAVVLTCRNERDANAFHREIEIRQKKGLIAQDVILLTVEDPKSEVGSGGATLNALLVVSEYISAKQGFTVVNSDVLQSSLILIVHMGRRFPFDSTGVGAFVTLPLVRREKNAVEGLVCNMDLLLEMMTYKIALTTTSGVWVCSSDMFLNVHLLKDLENVQTCDACVITVPAEIKYAMMHGVCKLNAEGFVEDILYQCKCEDMLRTCALSTGLVPLVSGVVYFSARVAERLLSFHVMPPLDCCTYLGIDSGSSPICISLYFDVMLALCQGMTEDKFIARHFVSSSAEIVDSELISAARRLIWNTLCTFRVRSAMVEGQHSYMDSHQPRCHLSHMFAPVCTSSTFSSVRLCHSHVDLSADVSPNALLINSIVGDGVSVGSGTVVVHCSLEKPLKIGRSSVVSGLTDSDVLMSEVALCDNIALQVFTVTQPNTNHQVSQRVFVVTGITDCSPKPETFCADSFASFLARTGIKTADLWHETIPEQRRTLFNAQLYAAHPAGSNNGFIESLWLQGARVDFIDNDVILHRWRSSWRLSIDDILSILDVEAEFVQRRKLFFAVGKLLMNETLLGCRDNGLNGLFQCAAVEGYAEDLCSTLDEIGAKCESAGSAARTLANIADVLGAMSRGDGGLRSGPASNQQWQSAFELLEREDISGGFVAMSTERKNWLSQPAHLIRAARHYEGAAQILIRHAVMTARQFIDTKSCELPPMSKWAIAECPARVDVAGGWSDTPPITYEHGGVVVDVAITVDGQKPVGAKARRIESLHIVLHVQGSGPLVIAKLCDLKDYNQPHVPGALLKAALICAKIVQYPSQTPLEVQLAEQYGSGFELSTWSHLPHGSGLGTSSILAGAIMAVLWRASGKRFNIDSLNHAVLHLEQMLTTGGGWQDQVGGLAPGIKIGHSKAELPVKIDVTFLAVPKDVVKAFSDQLILIYTGKTRLAKNLLQNVVRNWYARNPDIVETENLLVENAWQCAEAFKQGDLAGVGRCMSIYWSQKKKMAPGCEPKIVTKMMEALKSHALGMSLAGAGGGGFMYLLAKEPGMIETVKQILQGIKGADDVQVYAACVDESGLTLTVEDVGQENVPFQF